MAKRRLPNIAKKNKLIPIWIILAVVVVVVGVFVYQGIRELSGNPILRSQDDVPRLTVGEVQQALQNERAILLDVRSPEQYAASHVRGALSAPLGEIESYLPGLDKEAWYIIYCT